jgi:hypothetical protein
MIGLEGVDKCVSGVYAFPFADLSLKSDSDPDSAQSSLASHYVAVDESY